MASGPGGFRDECAREDGGCGVPCVAGEQKAGPLCVSVSGAGEAE